MSERTFQFDAFELQEHSGELRKHGRIRIQEQPFQILLLLLDRPGEIVGREEIRAKLWPENTFVDFDNAISSAVRKLREALSDSADNPRFIETLARRGYRFIGPIAPQPQALPMPPPKRTRTKAAAIVAGTLLILGVTSWWLWPRPKPATVQLAPLPLTAAAGLETEPSFSPDGNQIAYAWDETGARNDSHIYVKLIGSGRPVQLTSGANADSYPAWSPDGRAIAFVRALGRGNAIYWIPPVGGAERKLADGYFARGISWSLDGKFLAIAERQSPNGLPSLYRIAVENGERLRLTTPPNAQALDGDPVFSPNGRTLLFTRCHGLSTCGLYLLDLSPDYRPRAEPRLLKQEDVPISGAAWTVDGREVVYALSSGDFWSYQLRRIRVEAGAQPERLSYAGERVSMPAIARNRNRLAYQQSLEDTDVWRIEPGKPAR
ncbi:MAG TPA: winged helix-turn-helix domain-containing protein, partial [Bryobacteraceae bacterium]|nr:winged helix-turn-helix domain-containing protein [Bryobacteraceae bacterium]